ncbi:MAG: hypothetical protein WEF28_09345, partial [Acidimicrobiia bacterium]
STSLQDDDHLFFTLEANAVYAFEAALSWSAVAAGAGPQVHWLEPDGTFDLFLNWVAGTTLQTSIAFWDESTGSLPIHSSAIAGMAHFVGLIIAGVTGGAFKLQWAQAGFHASNTKMLKGSWLSYKKLN